MPTSCCFPLFLICLLLFIYIFIQPVLFCLHVGSFSFLFLDVFQSGKRCEFFAAFPNHLQLVASRKQCLHRKRKVPFVLIWLVLSTGSFGALYNGFCHMPANTFHVAAYLQCLIMKQILLLLHLMPFTVSTGFNAWPVCRGFLIHRFFYESSRTGQFRDGACVAIAWSNQEGVFSNTLLPQRFILRRI